MIRARLTWRRRHSSRACRASHRACRAAARSAGAVSAFPDRTGPRVYDDHTPFLEAGVPSIDLIDFDYPHWHTPEDTFDKVSAESLKAVAEVGMALVRRKGR